MPKIVVALLNAAQEFQQLQARDARDTGSRLGFEVEVVFAEGHAVVQIQQLFEHIHAPEEKNDRPRSWSRPLRPRGWTGWPATRRRRGSAGSW